MENQLTVGKIVAVLSTIVGLGLPSMIFYAGRLDNRVTTLETAEDKATVIILKQIAKEIDRLNTNQAKLIESTNENDIKWAEWNGRWGHLLVETQPVSPVVPKTRGFSSSDTDLGLSTDVDESDASSIEELVAEFQN